jgi:hypothetical protein
MRFHSGVSAGRLLTFNCHEAWVHQLARLARPLDIIDGLEGRYTDRWDERMRPVPPGASLVSLAQARSARRDYDCIIGHNLSDLMAIDLDAPRILVLHVTLEHRLAQSGLRAPPVELVQSIERYLALSGGCAIAVTERKAASWGLNECAVVESAADPDDYLPWRGDRPLGLRIANQIGARRAYLAWDLHEAAFAEVPVTVLGHNPDMVGVAPARDWQDLKVQLAAHRFFIHTASTTLEDGFNMALMEALAAGLPTVGNRHPTSPIEHGVSGFLSDDPLEIASYARRLLDDHALAARMSRAAQALARRRFPSAHFCAEMEAAIARAQRCFGARRRP